MKHVRWNVSTGGYRNGEPAPARGDITEVDDVEAAQLAVAGHVTVLDEAVVAAEKARAKAVAEAAGASAQAAADAAQTIVEADKKLQEARVAAHRKAVDDVADRDEAAAAAASAAALGADTEEQAREAEAVARYAGNVADAEADPLGRPLTETQVQPEEPEEPAQKPAPRKAAAAKKSTARK